MRNRDKSIEQYQTEIEVLRQRVKELEGLELIQGKRSEDRIWQQNEFASTVLESLAHPFYVVDVNDYVVKLTNRAAVSGKLSDNVTCYALTHKRNKPCEGVEHVCPLEEVKKTGKPVVVEHVHYDKDGNTRNVELHAFPVFDSNGNVIQIIEYCLDITQRKQAEEEVHKLLMTIETAKEAINIASADGTITYANSAMDNLFGYKKGELIGKHPHILNAGINPEVVTTKVMDAIRKKGFWEGEIYNKRKDGTKFTSYAKISALKDKEDKILNFLSTQHDITERKRFVDELRNKEQKISQLAAAYVQAHEEESQWISLELHDRIVQPLFTIIQQIEQLKSQISDNPNVNKALDDCLNLIQEVGRETRNVTHDLYPATLARYGLVRLMNDELTKLEDETGCQTKLSVQKNLRIDHNITTTLYRVFHEALLNIRKHAGASRVVISLKRRKGTIELKIEDDGVGFDVAQEVEEVPGGLESMRRRTEIVGGSFKLMSTPGAGTNLVCCVPVPSR